MIMNPLKSIVARYQGYILTNIQKSKYGKKLREIKNSHKGERCFVVANGPSLTSEDLEKIYQNNEYSFGMNRIYKMFDQQVGDLHFMFVRISIFSMKALMR